MIAWAGIERFRAGHRDGLDLRPAALAAGPGQRTAAGRRQKGPKA